MNDYLIFDSGVGECWAIRREHLCGFSARNLPATGGQPAGPDTVLTLRFPLLSIGVATQYPDQLMNAIRSGLVHTFLTGRRQAPAAGTGTTSSRYQQTPPGDYEHRPNPVFTGPITPQAL